jgi:hypothetical protein
MTEETTTTEGTAPATPNVISVDEHKAALESAKRGIVGQLTEAQAEIARRDEAEAAREKAELEANGELQQLLDKVKAEHSEALAQIESIKAAHNREKTSTALDRALERDGVNNEYTRQGILAEYLALDEQPEIAEFVNSLKESKPDVFAAAPAGVGVKNAPAGVAKQTGRMTDEQLDAMLTDKDPKVREQAHGQVLNELGIANRRF